tara:strand:- start:113 stop:862 length:750 start_codon:yes stop_codon:yes gene_type:complete
MWWNLDEEDDNPLENIDAVNENAQLRDDPLFADLDTGPRGPTPWGGERYKMPWHRRLGYTMMRKGWGGSWFSTPSPTHRIEDADRISLARREFVAVHTPGHTADHLCLFDPEEGVMLCGDHVLPTITPHISGFGPAADPLKDFFESLDRVGSFEGVKLGLPAHGQPFDNLSERVLDIKCHHEERLNMLRESSDHLGRASVQEYMKELFKQRSWGPMAESETFAHLEHLRQTGENDATRNSNGVLEYAFR